MEVPDGEGSTMHSSTESEDLSDSSILKKPLSTPVTEDGVKHSEDHQKMSETIGWSNERPTD